MATAAAEATRVEAPVLAAAHAVAWGVGMFGYGGRQGLGRGLKVQCGGGRGECSRVCLCASTAVLPGQGHGVSGVVAKAAAVAKGELCGMGSDGLGIYGAWWLRHGWCGDVGRAVRWCV